MHTIQETTLDTTTKGLTLAIQLAGHLPNGFTVLGLLKGGGYTNTPLVHSPSGRYLRVANGTQRGFDTHKALDLIDKADQASAHPARYRDMFETVEAAHRLPTLAEAVHGGGE
jgi:hypothetical protein